MKKTIAVIVLILVIASVTTIIHFQNLQKREKEILKYNMEYEEYNVTGLNGLDITTIINKALNENERNNVQKDEFGFFINNGENSINIEIQLTVNGDGKIYQMEQFNQVGMDDFIEAFATMKYDCKKVEYHTKTGKIAYMLFAEQEIK